MEKEKTKLLYKNAKSWNRVNIIREYIKELELRMALEKELNKTSLTSRAYKKIRLNSQQPFHAM